MIKILSNCGHDERWGYIGGAAGDNNGTEWQLVPFYRYPWNLMLRYPDAEVRHWMGDQARAAALNDCIGYDQGQRGTFWANLEDSNYDAAQITVKCETDCSAGVLAICKAAGYHFGIEALKNINQWSTTWYEEDILRAAGFEVYREYKYIGSDDYLDNGDILLNIENHTAFNVSRGMYCDALETYNVISDPVNNMGMYYRGHCQTFGDMPLVHDGQWAGTKGKCKRLEGFWINPAKGLTLEIIAHLQGIGDKPYTNITHGTSPFIGTIGECRRLEGISIKCIENTTGMKLHYQGHCQTYGDTDICSEGEFCGTRGESKRLEAIRIWLDKE